MSSVSVRGKRANFTFVLAILMVVAFALLRAASAGAQADTFLNGDGHDGAITYNTAGTYSPNALAPIPGALTEGTSTVTIGTIRAGVGAGNVTFANDRLIMIYQSNGVSSTPTSADQTAYPLSRTTAGHWELARIQTVAGSTLTLTNPLINSYAAGTAQAIAIPEWSGLTVSNAGVNITAQAWNGATGGVVAALIQNTASFTAAGTIHANAAGFRGGIAYLDNSAGTTNCPTNQYDAPSIPVNPNQILYAAKGEGFYPAGFAGSAPPTLVTQVARGNYINAGGGGNCFNAGGGGGGNGGQGGLGGNTLVGHTDGNRVAGGLGGAALTYNPYSQSPFGGGGGAGERNDTNAVNGGAGGGFVLVRGGTLTGSGNFRANGANGVNGNINTNTYPDGASGGGAGGVVLLRFVNGTTCGAVSANGGAGGNNITTASRNWTGGGGGAGGKTYVQGSSISCAATSTGGAAGTNGGNSYGATAGAAGASTSSTTSMTTPTVTVTVPTAAQYFATATPAFSGTATNNSTVFVYIDGVYSGTTTASGAGAWSYTPPSISQGPHNVTVYSEVAGIDSASVTRAFTIDTTAPTVVLSAPANGATVNTTTPTVTYSVTETNPSANTYCIVDGGAPVACTSGSALAALSQGSHTLQIRHTDLAGNIGNSATHTFTVDSIAPSAPAITTPAASPYYTSDTTPTVAGTAEANSTVRVYDGVTLVGTTTANGSGNWTLDTSALSVGSHTITATATDAANNTSAASGSKTIVIDTTAPSVSLTAPANGSTVNTATPAITFSVTDTNPSASSSCIIDGGAPVSCTSGYVTGTLTQGSHTVQVQHTDLAGNVGSSSTNTFTVDSIAPSAPTITTPATSPYHTNDTTPTVGGTAEAGSTVRVYDGVTLVGTTTADGSGNWTLDTSALAVGSHTITATATDAANNTSAASGSKTIVIDTTAPAAPAITTPATSPYYSSTTTPTVGGTAEAGSTVRVYDGVTLVGTTTADGSGNWSLSTSALSVGSHTITATATDAASNTSAASGSKTIIVDTTAPAVAITAPLHGTSVSTTTPTITFTVTDTNPSASSSCIIDGGAPVSCTSGYVTGALTDGSHTVQVQHTDLAGNVGSSTTNTFTVDTTAPSSPTITTPASSPFHTSDTTPTVGGTAEAGSTVRVYDDVTLVGTTTADGGGNWSLDTSVLSEGSHTITATATDAVNNTSAASGSKTIVVDTTAPSAPAITTPAASPYYTSDTTPTVAGTAEADSTVRVYDGVTLVGTTTADGSGNWSLDTSALSEGSHTITATATDAAGNASAASGSKTIVVDTTAPSAPAITTPAASPYYTSDTTPTVAGTAEADSTVNVYDGVTLVGTTTADGGGNWSLDTSALSEGSHTITATATDAANNTSTASGSKTIVVDTTAPTVALTAPANGAVVGTSTPTVTFSVTDTNPSASSSCIVDGGAPVSCTSGYVTGTLTDGTHTVQVQHTDLAGNVGSSATNTFTVDTTAPAAPTITTPATSPHYTSDTTPTVAGTAEADSTVRVYDGVTLVGTTTADGSGDWSLDTSALSEGSHSITATATDAANNTSAASGSKSIVIDTTAPTVTLTAPANGALLSTDTPAITFSVTDDNPSAGSSCIIDGGAPVSCTSGYVTGSLTDGTHTVLVEHTDLAGNTGSSATHTFTVDTTAPAAPTITTPATSPFHTSDTTPTVAGTAEPDSTVNVYDGVTLVGTTTADGSGDWSLDTSTLSEGSHTITATATDAANNTSAASGAKTIVVDTTAPAAPTITTPATSPFHTNDTTPTVAGTAEPDSTVNVYDGVTLVGTTTADGSGDWSLDTSTLAEGSHTITATATDAANNTSAASGAKTIVIDTTAPAAPAITTPATSPHFTADTTPTVAGTAEPDSTVNVYDGVTLVGTTTADGSGDWSLDTSTLAEGSHTITATATDAAGNTSSASGSKTIIVDTTAPAAPVITNPPGSPTYTSLTSPTVGGTAEADSTVRVYEGANLIGTTTADGAGNWSLSTSALSDGTYTVTATATDATNNTSAASNTVTIIVDTTAPIVSISSPANGSTITTATPTVNFSVTELNQSWTSECQVDGGAFTNCTSGWSSPALTDGSHTIVVRHYDIVGNVGSASTTFTVDATPPDAPVITSGPSGTVASTSATFAFTGEAGATFECYVDSPVAWTPCTSPENYSGLDQGPHTFHVRQTDTAGNTGPEATQSWSVDTVGPPAPSVSGPSGTVGSSSATITFSDTESPVTFMCSLDGAPAALCTSPVSLTGLTDGPHSYAVHAVDALGNAGSATTINWTVDSSLFTVSITAGPTGTVATSDNTLEFEATITAGTTYSCRVDGGAWSACTSPFSTGSLTDGSHTFEVYATNGSQDSPAESRSWTIDTAAPSIAISSPTDGQTVAPSGNADFTATDGTGPVTTTCAIDADTPVNCTSPFAFSGLGDGPHSVTVTATDGVGNSTSLVRNFVVDATPPQTTITSAPADPANSTSATFEFSSSEGSSTFECSLDGAPFASCTSPDSYSGLSEGSHTFEVRATDSYGNTDATPASHSWTIDTTAPAAPAITTPASDIVTNDTTPAIGGTAEPGSTVDVYDGVTLIGTAVADVNGDWSLSPDPTLAEGVHQITATATDEAGNTGPSSGIRTITVDLTDPTVSITAPSEGSVTNDSTPDVSFTAGDANAVTTECRVDTDAFAPCTSPWTTAALSDGPHTVEVRATDAAGNTATDQNSFTVDTTAPTAPAITTPPTDVVSGNPVQPVGGTAEAGSTVDVYDGLTLIGTVTADGGGNWSLSPDPTFAEGSHNITATATDGAGNTSAASQARTITIDTTAPAAPVITSPADGTTTGDTTPQVSGTAEPGATVKVHDGPTELCTATADVNGDWSCTSSVLSEGPHTLIAKATDPSGNESGPSAGVGIVVDTTNPDVQITAPSNGATVGTDTPAISFTASDASGVTTECQVDGDSFVACTSPWTTPSLSDGPHTVTVRATDGGGNTATAAVTFTVDTTAPAAPVITSPADGTTTGDTTPLVSGTAEPGATVKVHDGPTELCTATADVNGDWSCTSSVLSEGPHTLTAKATDPSGNESGPSAGVGIVVDTTNPDVQITAPSNGATVGTDTPAISFTASDASGVTTECQVDGDSFVACTSPWTTPSLSDGPHTVTVRATDGGGNTATAAVTFTVDTTAPSAPAITTPPNDVVSGNPVQPVGGTAEAGSTVDVYDGATLIGTVTADGGGNWSLSPDPTFAEGDHDITATATDAVGNTSAASQIRKITIDTTAPAAPVIAAPADGATTGDPTPLVSGTAEPGSTVKVYDGPTELCTATADVNGDWSCTSATLSEGPHALTAKATDPAGNESGPSADVDVVVDTTNPDVQITAPSNGATVSTHTPAVSFTASDASGVTTECKADSGTYVSCTSPWTTPSLADGSHTVTVRATDGAGNVATAAVTFTVDTTAPVVTITQGVPSLDNDPTPTIQFTSDEPGSTFECRIDGGAWTACTSPFTVPAPLADGPHTIDVRATDTNGNVGSPKSTSWTLDTTPPAKPVVSAPSNGSLTNDATPAISGTAEPNSSVEVFVDGNSIGTVTANGSGSWTITSPHLTDGTHAATARATDGAGNTGALSDPSSFTVDTTPPNGSVVEQSGSGGDGKNPTFNITPDEGDSTIACALDGGASSPCSSPFTPSGTLAPGSHTLVVTFTDPAGNSRQVTITFFIGSGGGDPLPAGCFAKGIAIANLAPSGSKVTLSGFTRLSYVGQTVKITYKPTGSKVLATAVVGADGSFKATMKAPAKKLWLSNKSLYRATVGGESTPWTKLSRRVASATASYSGGKLVVNGLLSKPLMPKAPATITARTGCDQPWATVGSAKVAGSGKFSLSVPYTQSTGVIFVRVAAVVSKGGKKPKPLRTYSFVIPVVVR